MKEIKKVLVAGLGKSGISAARLAYSEGINVIACDGKKLHQLESFHGKALPEWLDVFCESDGTELINKVDTAVISPGITSDCELVKKAIKNGKKVISEIEFASLFLDVPVIAITGTNGKTTVTTLIGEILKAEGKNVRVAGNIGIALSDFAVEKFKGDFLVVEVSSFQLELIENFKPKITLILNVTPDHLDRYKSLKEYGMAKMNIFKNQDEKDFLVLNGEDEFTRRNIKKHRACAYYFSKDEIKGNGAFVRDGGMIFRSGRMETFVMSVNDIRMMGVHNLENALASVCSSFLAGAGAETAKKVLMEFLPPAHRMEDVDTIKGVRFINDSKATNVDALKRALESFKDKIVLIAGGRDKKGDFQSLRTLVSMKVRVLVLVGEASGKISEAYGDAVETYIEDNMKKAVERAFKCSASGDIVILSPGCASFDMYRSFEERGEDFKNRVRELRQDA